MLDLIALIVATIALTATVPLIIHVRQSCRRAEHHANLARHYHQQAVVHRQRAETAEARAEVERQRVNVDRDAAHRVAVDALETLCDTTGDTVLDQFCRDENQKEAQAVVTALAAAGYLLYLPAPDVPSVFILMEADNPDEPLPTIGIFTTVDDAKAACSTSTEWKHTSTYEWAGRHTITQPNVWTRDLYLIRQVPFGERFEQ